MAASLRSLVDQQQQELGLLKRQLAAVTQTHQQTLTSSQPGLRALRVDLQALHDRERDSQRQYHLITELRDAAVGRDLDLASTRQALQTSEADHDLVEAKYRSRMHAMEQQVAELQKAEHARRRLNDEHQSMTLALREQTLTVQSSLKEEQVRVMALRERESLLEERCAALQSALELKGQELSSALQRLTRSSEEAQRMQDEARQMLLLRESQLSEVESQVRMLADAEGMRAGEQRAQLAALMASLNELRNSCEVQAAEITSLTASTRRLEGDKARLKGKLKELAAVVATVQVDRDSAQEGVAREVAAHHATQMQLTLAQHRVREAAIRTGKDLEPSLLVRPPPAGTAAANAAASINDAAATQATGSAQALLHAFEAERVSAQLSAEADVADPGDKRRALLAAATSRANHHQQQQQGVSAAGAINPATAASQAALQRAQSALDDFRASMLGGLGPAAAHGAAIMPSLAKRTTAASAPVGGGGITPRQDALDFLAQRASQLSAENASLRAEMAGHTAAAAHSAASSSWRHHSDALVGMHTSASSGIKSSMASVTQLRSSPIDRIAAVRGDLASSPLRLLGPALIRPLSPYGRDRDGKGWR